jgi:riboflavin kinase / FMN adenylyltransferase
VQVFRSLDRIPAAWRRGAVAVGNFDGVHRGHARIVRRLVAKAAHVGGPAVVLTFDPHPAVIAYPTDAAFLQLGPREFFDRIVRGALEARAMVEGANFFFGRNRAGDIQVLRQLCDGAGLALEIVEPVTIDGQIVSSSRVRALVAQGHVEEVSRLLTQPYRIRGQVIHGAGRGVQLGFPTANLGEIATLLPAEGIYAGRALADGDWWPGAISLGPNPTFDESGQKVEVHLLDYRGLLYDRWIEVEFLARLRGIEKFPSIEGLLAQMHADVAAARAAAEDSAVRVRESGQRA